MISCSKKQDKQVVIYKQWHLSPDVQTLDIKMSQKLPQAKNQLAIYKDIINDLKKSKSKINFLSEGCEGDSKVAFSQSYNGWTLKDLIKVKNNSNFESIIAPIGMKLLAKYEDRVNVLCSDNSSLVKKHLLVFSDIKGFLNYYLKFNEIKKGSLEYKKYLSSLKEVTDKSDIPNPVSFIKEMLLEKINEFEELLYKRNKSFIQEVKRLSGKSFIVIGGLHTKDLKSKLLNFIDNVELKTPQGYNDQDDLLIDSLKRIISTNKRVVFSSVPSKFSMSKFPLSNLIDEDKLMSPSEKKSLLKSLTNNENLFKFLLSDFDKDGIRDFTLSTSKDHIVVSAEDSDWDNDGIPNIVDSSVGRNTVGNVDKLYFENLSSSFKIEKQKKLIEYFKSEKINLVNLDDSPHFIEVLEYFKLIYSQLKKEKYIIKNIIAKVPQYTYGKQVFFSYNKGSYSLEYYPKELKKYLEVKRKTSFLNSSDLTMFSGFTSPLIIHSLSHEIIHSRDFSKEIDLRANKWSFDIRAVNSIYLSAYRSPNKTLLNTKLNTRYKGMTYKEWLIDHKNYVNTLNSLLKREDRFLELVKTTPWYTGTNSKKHEHQASYLGYNKLVSIYSTHSPDEWLAENLAMCLFKKIYKLKESKVVGAKYEVLLGINPFGVNTKLCHKINL